MFRTKHFLGFISFLAATSPLITLLQTEQIGQKNTNFVFCCVIYGDKPGLRFAGQVVDPEHGKLACGMAINRPKEFVITCVYGATERR
jgi:hypothetical protein